MRLLSNELETPTTRRVRLALEGTPFRYLPGQSLSLAKGATEPTPYSIASAPCETAGSGWLELLVKVDGSSRFGAIVDRLEPGTDISVAGPTGDFILDPDSRSTPLLFIAGGTGIAPLRSMIHQALHDQHHGKLALVYSARSPAEFAYANELRELADAGRLALTLTLTGDAENWTHSRGRAGARHLSEHINRETMAFVCGPPPMVEELPAALVSLGATPERIRTEHW